MKSFKAEAAKLKNPHADTVMGQLTVIKIGEIEVGLFAADARQLRVAYNQIARDHHGLVEERFDKTKSQRVAMFHAKEIIKP